MLSKAQVSVGREKVRVVSSSNLIFPRTRGSRRLSVIVLGWLVKVLKPFEDDSDVVPVVALAREARGDSVPLLGQRTKILGSR